MLSFSSPLRWLAATGVVVMAALALSASVLAVLDQSQENFSGHASQVGGSRDVWAQTFTAGITGTLDSVELYLSQSSNGQPTVQIHSVSGGVPTSTVLASTALPAASVPNSPGWVSFTFATPAAITGNTQYAIVASGPPDTAYHWLADSGAPYTRGTAFSSSFGNPFVAWNFDFVFRTYATGVTSVQLRSVSATSTQAGALVRWRTASESRMLGFRVYRDVKGKRVRVTPRLIAATGRRSYSFLDRTAPRQRSARYWIQVVNMDGSGTWYGPARLA